MESDRAPATSEEKAISASGPKTLEQPSGIDRHYLRTENRHPVGGFAPRDGLRQRHDLLASPAGLAKSGCLEPSPSGLAQPFAGCRPDRLFPRGGGLGFRPSRFWGAQTGPNPTDRAKSGTKHHLITDARGIPLAVKITGANRNDITQLLPLVDAIPPIAGKVGRPRRRPDRVQGDRAYDSQPHRRQLRRRGILPVLARRGTPHGSGLGKHRWVIERTIAWFFQHRRLRVRYERRPDIHEAFLLVTAILICWNFLAKSF
jgi:transposase